MQNFVVIPDAFVILRTKGGYYKQAKVYERDHFIYAGLGSSFILLKKHGTSAPGIYIEYIELGFKPMYTNLERMCTNLKLVKLPKIEAA